MKEALLYEKLPGASVRCDACAHACVIAPGRFGRCRVRRNDDGVLTALTYGKLIAAHLDPIEKKPLYHFLPGSASFSVAAVGCNFICSFCQNWGISQAVEAERHGEKPRAVSPEEIVAHAVSVGATSIAYTYTEPAVFIEYAYDTAVRARAAGLANVFVTNGYLSAAALALVAPVLDAANVDLKFADEEGYAAHCGARRAPVLGTIRALRARGVWVEVTTLVIPGLNDGSDSLAAIARDIAAIGVDIPWHLSAFHPDYRLLDAPVTPLMTLERGRAIGAAAGLRYIYMGNTGAGADTRCHHCGAVLIRRKGFSVIGNAVRNGRCPACDTSLSGVFTPRGTGSGT